MSGGRMREIAEREAFDALPPNDWFEASAALFHAETGMLPPGKDDAGAHDRDDREQDWSRWRAHRARELSRQCRKDRAWLLARCEALEAALWPFAAAADGITPEMDHPILIASHYGAGTGGRATHWQVHVDAFRAARAALSPDSEP